MTILPRAIGRWLVAWRRTMSNLPCRRKTSNAAEPTPAAATAATSATRVSLKSGLAASRLAALVGAGSAGPGAGREEETATAYGRPLFDNLIRPQQQRRRDGEAERLGGFEV